MRRGIVSVGFLNGFEVLVGGVDTLLCGKRS